MSFSPMKNYKEIIDAMVASMSSSTPATEVEKSPQFLSYLTLIQGDLHRQKLLFTLQRLDKRFKQYAWESIFRSITNHP